MRCLSKIQDNERVSQVQNDDRQFCGQLMINFLFKNRFRCYIFVYSNYFITPNATTINLSEVQRREKIVQIARFHDLTCSTKDSAIRDSRFQVK